MRKLPWSAVSTSAPAHELRNEAVNACESIVNRGSGKGPESDDILGPDFWWPCEPFEQSSFDEIPALRCNPSSPYA
jgi:hypothetical protein